MSNQTCFSDLDDCPGLGWASCPIGRSPTPSRRMSPKLASSLIQPAGEDAPSLFGVEKFLIPFVSGETGQEIDYHHPAGQIQPMIDCSSILYSIRFDDPPSINPGLPRLDLGAGLSLERAC